MPKFSQVSYPVELIILNIVLCILLCVYLVMVDCVESSLASSQK